MNDVYIHGFIQQKFLMKILTNKTVGSITCLIIYFVRQNRKNKSWKEFNLYNVYQRVLLMIETKKP